MTTISVATNRGDLGGGEVMLLRLAAALRALGHDVTVVAPSTPGDVAAEAARLGLAVVTISCTGRRDYALGLRRWHRGRTELLWCNGLLPAAATAGRRRRVVHLHQLPSGRQRHVARLARWRAEATVVPSGWLRAHLGPDVRVLPNWTDGELAAVPARPAAAGRRVTIGYLGRIGRGKGVTVLAEACRLLAPDVRDRVELLIAGDDRFVPAEDRAAVETALGSIGIPVRRPGWLDRAEFFAAVDLAVFPSVFPETFGLVVAEAMESGRPVVVSDAGALPEVVGPSYPWVTPAGDPGALARALTDALGRLPATELTQDLHRRWSEHYSPEAGVRGVADLLDGLARDRVLDPDPAGGR